jgi:hypothetical protein
MHVHDVGCELRQQPREARVRVSGVPRDAGGMKWKSTPCSLTVAGVEQACMTLMRARPRPRQWRRR